MTTGEAAVTEEQHIFDGAWICRGCFAHGKSETLDGLAAEAFAHVKETGHTVLSEQRIRRVFTIEREP